MEINISLIDKKFMDCYQVTLANICSYYELNYELMFSEEWFFRFTLENSSTIGEALNIHSKTSYTELLEIYCGLKFLKIDYDQNEAIKLINLELSKGRPVVLFINSFWCPWDPNYHRNEMPHACIIYKVTHEGFYCCDNYYMKKSEFLSLDYFCKGYLSIMIFERLNDSKFDPIFAIENNLRELFKTSNGKNSFEEMEHFSECILNNLCLEKEVVGHPDPSNSPFFRNLLSISRGRKLYSLFLDHLINNYNIDYLRLASSEIYDSGFKWEIIRNLLLKMFFSKDENFSIEKIYLKILSVIELEKKISKDILSNNIKLDQTQVIRPFINEDLKESVVYCVNLSSYFNNCGFGNIATYTKADFTQLGEFFIHNEKLDVVRTGEIYNIKFNWLISEHEELDNISSVGQIININAGNYSEIYILGCSEWGNVREEITLFYNDGYNVSTTFAFSDWGEVQPQFGEEVACTLDVYSKNNGHISDRRLYIQKIYLEQDRKLIKIKLPDSPTLHVFAITVISQVDKNCGSVKKFV